LYLKWEKDFIQTGMYSAYTTQKARGKNRVV